MSELYVGLALELIRFILKTIAQINSKEVKSYQKLSSCYFYIYYYFFNARHYDKN